MNFSRRNFLKVGMGGAAVTLLQGCHCPCFGGKPKPRVGVQLYSVRGLCKKDFFGTMRDIRKIGYEGVEFAGYYGKTAKELHQMLADSGLRACGTHIGLGSILPGQINKTMDFAQETGFKYLIVPGMGPGKGYKGTLGDWWKETAEKFSAAAETAKKRGMYVGYHNHQHEFKTHCKDHGNKCLFEIFWDNTSTDVSMQMDVGHVVSAGEDPIYWLNRYPNHSCRTVHAKETYPGPGILGQPAKGKKGVDWDKFLPAVEKKNVEWYVVETEADPNTLSRVEGCFKFLVSKGRA